MAFLPFMFDALNKSMKIQMEQMPPEVFAWMTEPQNCPYSNRQQSSNGCPFFNQETPKTNPTKENVPEEPTNEFKVNLDVHEFRPEEITIKVVDGNVIHVEAKHEERKDENGFVSRHLVRKYNLPQGFDASKVFSKLSTDGVLTITAPKIEEVGKAREIKVVQTGRPAKENEKNVDGNNGEKKDGNVENKE